MIDGVAPPDGTGVSPAGDAGSSATSLSSTAEIYTAVDDALVTISLTTLQIYISFLEKATHV